MVVGSIPYHMPAIFQPRIAINQQGIPSDRPIVICRDLGHNQKAMAGP